MSGVGMHEVSREGITHIVRNLRERDRREIFALRWNDDEDALIEDINRAAGAMWKVWSWDSEPVSINGVLPVRPGVVICGAFGTDQWRKTLRPMTHWSRDFVIPALQASGYHRGEAHVLAANTDSRRWIEMLGGKVEALLQGYGRNREDFLLYAWDLTKNRSEWDVLPQRQQQWASNGHGAIH
jgi:RimJ/RimL family protein N-acetyltransferase